VLACSGCSSSHRKNHQKPPKFLERGENLPKNGVLHTLCILDQSIVRNRTSKFTDFTDSTLERLKKEKKLLKSSKMKFTARLGRDKT